MKQDYEIIVIGGGHNGLVAAAYLAKAGRKVLVLEKRDVLGGAAATEALFPDFKVDTGAVDVSLFRKEIFMDLDLGAQGVALIDPPAAVFAPQPDGRGLTLWRDVSRSQTALTSFSSQDAERFPKFHQEATSIVDLLDNMMGKMPPDLGGLGFADLREWGGIGLQLKRMGSQAMMNFMRVLPMPVKDYLEEWFESPALQGLLGSYGITGMRQGPRSAGTAFMFFYQHLGGLFAPRFVAGGIGHLSDGLAAAARKAGAEIRTGTGVGRILVEELDYAPRAVGVELENGEVVRAPVVVSNLDPRRTLFGLLGPQHLEPHFMRQVRNIIYRGSTAKVVLALNGLPNFNGQTSLEELSGHIRIAPSLDYLERAYDAAKYGRISEKPYLDIVIPSINDPSLAPDGKQLMLVTMQFAPYELREGSWEDQRESLGDLVLDTLAPYAPDLKTRVANWHVITPLDWEQTYGLTEGSIFHGQMGLDQLLVMRPVSGWGRYQMPVSGLYLCGAGAHPGGGVTGAPGFNAARAVLKG